MTAGDFLNTSDYLLARAAPEDVALVEGSERYTYRQLREAAGKLAAGLASLDLPPGSRVGVPGPNSLFWVAAYLAVMKLGQIYHSTWRPDLPEPSQGREPLILHVGPICRNKGQLDLVNAFGSIAQRSPQWRLILIGRRAEEWTVAEIGVAIERHRIKDRVVMPGELESESVFKLMKQSSVFALPSYSEGLPLVVQEALHYGCPVIGYATGGIPELIEHEENGLLIPRGNVRALQDGLERLINDTHSREEFGRNARDSIERKGMNAKTMKALYRALYGDVLSESSRGVIISR